MQSPKSPKKQRLSALIGLDFWHRLYQWAQRPIRGPWTSNPLPIQCLDVGRALIEAKLTASATVHPPKRAVPLKWGCWQFVCRVAGFRVDVNVWHARFTDQRDVVCRAGALLPLEEELGACERDCDVDWRLWRWVSQGAT